MSKVIQTSALSADKFAPFGDVLELQEQPDQIINQGNCGRHHDLAKLDFGGGRAGISLFDAKPRSLPYQLDLLERHPDGSQAFIPMSLTSFLIIVASDVNGSPGEPCAFVSAPGQAINIHKGVWHGVLTPLHAPGLFAVVDRMGPGPNLEEYRLAASVEIV
ncbi:ureidoglycolate lyase [Cognatishimia sp. WU-CL00825]|uniref:ureidoglycolate lyase n=1 Tax=Cognatishimia sp. WU-CL00825 TaxID=3127658 RepID=UPI0031031D20